MPLALEPDEVFEIVLDSDVKGEGPRPTFRFRHPTVRTWIRVAELTDSWEAAREEKKDAKGLMQEVLDIVAGRLVGWSNLKDEAGKPIPFDPEKLPDVVTVGEIFELMYKFRSGAALEADARKNSERPSSSGSESSAPDDAESATAPPKPNRP